MPTSPSMLPQRRTFSLSVSGRVLLVTVVMWVGLLAGLRIVLDRVFRPTFAHIESELLVKDLERIEAAVQRETEQLGATAEDYASWDDMRAFVETDGAEAPRVLGRSILPTLDLDAIFVFDAFGRVRHALQAATPEELERTREYTPAGFASEFPVIASARAQSGPGAARRGLVRFSAGKLVFAAAVPILPSDKTGRALGTLVMLRELDAKGIQRLGEQVRLPLELVAAEPKGPAVAASQAVPEIALGMVSASAWLRDPFGKPIARYEVERPAAILGQGEDTLNLGGVGSLFMLSLVLVVLLALLQISVVRPLHKLTRSIENVRRTGDLGLRIGMNRNDEIGLLAYNFDRLLVLLEDRTNVLEELATTDGLTKLRNRRTIMEMLDERVELAKSGEPVSVLLLDVDHFKRINDTAGHAMGDRVLRQVAEILRSEAHKGQEVGRYGGEEFLVVLPGYDRIEAAQVADRIRLAIESRPVMGLDWPVTVSIGVAAWGGHTSHGLLAAADMNLYRAKESGRNRVVAEDVPLSRLPAPSILPPKPSSVR